MNFPLLQELSSGEVIVLGASNFGGDVVYGRKSAIKVITDWLSSAHAKFPDSFKVISINGGDGINAIATESQAAIVASCDHLSRLWHILNDFPRNFVVDCKVPVKLSLQYDPKSAGLHRCFSNTDHVLKALNHVPEGSVSVAIDCDKILPNSFANIAAVSAHDASLFVRSVIISPDDSALDKVSKDLERIVGNFDATPFRECYFPSFKAREDGGLSRFMKGVYQELFGEPLEESQSFMLNDAAWFAKKGISDIVSIGALVDYDSADGGLLHNLLCFLMGVLNSKRISADTDDSRRTPDETNA
jgi:di/tripeptidase